MIVRTPPSVSYSIGLKRILDVHTSQAWDVEPTEVEEREEEQLNELWTGTEEPQWHLDYAPPAAAFDQVYAQLQAAV